MKKVILCILVAISAAVFCIRLVSSRNSDREIETWNSEIYSKTKNLGLNSILVYKQELYFRSNNTSGKSKNQFSEKMPLQYDISNYDIDLMPMIVSDKILLCQCHSLKVFSDGQIFEYKCSNQIVGLTYPKENKENLMIYLIEFNSDKIVRKVPESERKWVLYELSYSQGKFSERIVTELNLPKTHIIKQINSEVSFFRYSKNEIDVVLTNEIENESSIFHISDDGANVKNVTDGFIIIPNRFSDEFLWYIKKDKQNKFALMKNEDKICEINQFISQGYFVDEDTVELFFYDDSQFGEMDLYNGTYAPLYKSCLYLFNENTMINTYYYDGGKKSIFFNDKIRRDTVLTVF